jgi:hypothetical protein
MAAGACLEESDDLTATGTRTKSDNREVLPPGSLGQRHIEEPASEFLVIPFLTRVDSGCLKVVKNPSKASMPTMAERGMRTGHACMLSQSMFPADGQ